MIMYVIVTEYSNDQYDLVNLKFHAHIDLKFSKNVEFRIAGDQKMK